MHGFVRIAAAAPDLQLADPRHNAAAVAQQAAAADEADCAVVVFPELCLTGYTCADLFHQRQLLHAAETALADLAAATRAREVVLVVGAPVVHAGRLYNAAVVLQQGRMLGVVPKSYLPEYKEFYEKRWFCPGREVRGASIALAGMTAPFGRDLLFRGHADLCLGIELCEDLWTVVPPSSLQALAGATVLLNLSASNELVGKADYRRQLVLGQSARCVAAYAYASCGIQESTTDVVFSGHAMIAENGVMLAERPRFQPEPGLITADIDAQRLVHTRLAETSFSDAPPPEFRIVELRTPQRPRNLQRDVDPHPFVPGDPDTRDARCREIFDIQATGLARRLSHIGSNCAVIGVSGGLDSTLALLVVHAAWTRLGGGRTIAVTMPGYGTTERTYHNAVALCQAVGAELREIDIVPACEQHFRDIGHDPGVHDTTYENVQARERTQLLMDIANSQGGIVIGTGDLSEIALGWSTYNGDHMSMYAVNCSVPKTLIQYVVRWVAERAAVELKSVLTDVLDTPISPELLPRTADGKLTQRTEETIGPYELHDFFLYHAIKYGAPPAKILFLARHAFGDAYSMAELKRWLDVFVRRFFAMQFKRSCIPDGPKVGSISLSPRGDWRMPSDAACRAWFDTDS